KGKEAEEKKKNGVARAASDLKNEAKAEIHSGIEQIKSPNILQRAKAMIYAQSPVHRQFIEKGTRFNAALEQPLAFGEVSRTPAELATLGSPTEPARLLPAQLLAGLS